MKIKVVFILAKAKMRYFRPKALLIEQIKHHNAWWCQMSQIEPWSTRISETATGI